MTTKVQVAALFCAVLWGAGPAAGADFYDEAVMPVLKLQFPQANWWALLTANYQSKADTKKLYADQAFDTGVPALKTFVQSRRKLLLSDPEVSRQGPGIAAVGKEVTQTESGQTVLVTARLSDAVAVDNVQLFVAAGSFRPLFAHVHGGSGFAERRRRGGTGLCGGFAGLSGGNRCPVLRPGDRGRWGRHPGFQS